MLKTNLQGIEELLTDPKYSERILGVQTTTSCFAPRAYDSVVEVAKLCKKFNVHHVINSAYGLQCSKIASDIV
jgi:O-phospho-L-seryl-tRNASec:L-selenocysteinyl-tRNA synthase